MYALHKGLAVGVCAAYTSEVRLCLLFRRFEGLYCCNRCLASFIFLAVLLDHRLLHSPEAFHKHLSRARKVDPHVPFPEKSLSVGQAHSRSLEFQRRALPAASRPGDAKREQKDEIALSVKCTRAGAKGGDMHGMHDTATCERNW